MHCTPEEAGTGVGVVAEGVGTGAAHGACACQQLINGWQACIRAHMSAEQI